MRREGSLPFGGDGDVFRRFLSCGMGMGFTKKVVKTALEEGCFKAFNLGSAVMTELLMISLICKMGMGTPTSKILGRI